MVVGPDDASAATGALVDGRYRLTRRLRCGVGASAWRGTDELLRRPVAVQVFEPESVCVPDVFAAVRRVSRLTHSGLPQVLDANESARRPYLIGEWLGGRNLASVLAAGPLHPRCAAQAFRRVSEALAVAHAAGVYHLRLGPRSMVWTTSGQVKIVGLGVEAALAGTRADDPRRSDTRALAELLRLALAPGHGGESTIRPTSRQALRSWMARRRGVGRELESIADRVVRTGRRPIRTADRLAAELERVGRCGSLAVSARPIPIVWLGPRHRGVAA